jgi:arylsulfatase A-like enzyme
MVKLNEKQRNACNFPNYCKQSHYALKWIVLLLPLFLSAAVCIHAQDRPNIVFYITDDQSRVDASVYGAPPLLKTPNLDTLAAHGLVFDNAFIASPACAPSRAAMLTGLMPARNGAEANHTHPTDNNLYLTKILQAAGYEVAAFGKVAHGGSPPAKGFDFFNNVAKRGDLARAVETWHNNRADKSKPGCIMVGDKRPHVAWIANSIYNAEEVTLPPYFIDTRETREHWARYYTDITGIDSEVGKVYNWARTTFGSNFIFIYTSDHGAQWPFGKWNLYDAGIRVPFIVVWPDTVTPGTRTDAMISWVDIFPTFFDIVGAAAPAGLDGKSFQRVLTGDTSRHREYIYTTHSGDGDKNVFPIRSIRTESFKYILNPYPEYYHSNHSDMLRNDGAGAYWDSWDLMVETDSVAAMIRSKYYIRPEEEFYVLEDDPHEQKNLISYPAYQQQIEELRGLLENWMDEQEDTVTLFNAPYPITGPRPNNTDTIEPYIEPVTEVKGYHAFESNAEESVRVYSIPFSDRIVVQVASGMRVFGLQFYNCQGKLIAENNVEIRKRAFFDVPGNIGRGTYILQLVMEDENSIKKLVR